MAVGERRVNPPRTVVIVEDESLLAWSISRDLQRWGYAPSVAGTLADAGNLLRSTPPWAVLLDIRLPDGRGLDLISALDPAVRSRTIVMSAWGEVSTVVEAMRLGAGDFLQKPFEPAQLKETLARLAISTEEPDQGPASASFEAVCDGMVAQSRTMQAVLQRVRHFAQTPRSTVLLLGETGTGKTMIARALHRISARRDGPFIDVNCAAIPSTLLESELMGHERGAFTDARSTKKGLLEEARGGTLFLDEIGDMPLEMQAKILSFIETGTFRRLGATKENHSDVRIVTATHRDLKALVDQGRFREDLYYRLKVLTISIPALRERREDIPVLADTYLKRFAGQMDLPVPTLSPSVLPLLQSYDWPGNVRELVHVMEAALAIAGGRTTLRPSDLPLELPGALGPGSVDEGSPEDAPRAGQAEIVDDGVPTIRLRLDGTLSLDDVDREVLRQAMEYCRGNQVKAAELLRVSRHLLRYRLKKHGLMD